MKTDYNKSKKAIESRKKYAKSEKGIKSRNKAQKKYDASPKGIESRNKRKSNASYRIKNSIKSNLTVQLKSARLSKNKEKSMKYLGYSANKLVEHLESNFDDNMNWDNYGTYWNMDHIIPQSLYDFSNDIEIKKCWNVRNVRPLKKEDNCKKGKVLDIELVNSLLIEDLLPF